MIGRSTGRSLYLRNRDGLERDARYADVIFGLWILTGKSVMIMGTSL